MNGVTMNDVIRTECDNTFKIVERYSSCFEQLIKEKSAEVAYEKYGFGKSCLIHRGYYCPSKISDIIIGNVNRGRLSKRITGNSSPDFIFGYNSADELILVKQEYSTEVIFFQESVEIGLTFLSDGEIELISQCRYQNNQLISYVLCLYNPYENSIVEIDREEYKYFEDKLVVDWSRFVRFPKHQYTGVYEHQKYFFDVQDGYLASYTVREFDDEKPKEGFWDNHVFEIKLKRKI